MGRGKTMLVNTILLTATSLLMRTVGMSFQVYLSKRIGASGIGLFQLIMSVSMLSTTFALSGIRFATTRLVSEELGRDESGCVRAAVRRCLVYALSFGSAAMLLMWFGADYAGTRLIGDSRTVLSLKLLSLSLPAFSLSHVLAGYFTAVSRVIKSAAVQIIEQAVRIGVVVVALSIAQGCTIERACAIIVVGGVIGEMVSFLLLYILYIFDRRGISVRAGGRHLTRRMVGLAFPLALSAYARTSLSTLQNLLVPRGFKKSGASSERALADYGIIQGMVFPVITFPSAFFYSLAELLVPELTDAQVRGHDEQISILVSRTVRLCLLFSIGVCAILFCLSRELSIALYDNPAVGYYIRILSLLMPIMYLDSVTDGMLRGLGQHMYSMKYNILDSLISVVMVYILLPKYAVMGYIFMICFTEVFNFTLSIYRLSKITKIRVGVLDTLKAVLCAFGAVNVTLLTLRVTGFTLKSTGHSVTLHIVITALIYVFMIVLTGCVDKGDRDWICGFFELRRKIFKNTFKKGKENV